MFLSSISLNFSLKLCFIKNGEKHLHTPMSALNTAALFKNKLSVVIFAQKRGKQVHTYVHQQNISYPVIGMIRYSGYSVTSLHPKAHSSWNLNLGYHLTSSLGVWYNTPIYQYSTPLWGQTSLLSVAQYLTFHHSLEVTKPRKCGRILRYSITVVYKLPLYVL